MSKPMTATQWQAAMKRWAVPVEYWTGWNGRGRPARTGPFSNVNGVIVHHTGSTDKGTNSYLKFLFETGRTDLPAPLCQAATKADGTIVMGATGRANHAGKGSGTVLTKVIAESYSGELKPGTDNTDGNARFYGVEMCYRGVEGHKPTTAAYASTVRWAAAICDFHGWSAKSVIGHREWTRSKIDPGYINMATFRADVQKLLDAGPSKKPAPAPTTSTYTVKPGDTLLSIAKSHGLSLAQLLDLNSFSDIAPGDKIAIGTKPTPTPKPTPKPTPTKTVEMRAAFINAACYNKARGIVTAFSRIPKIGAKLLTYDADTITVVELSKSNLKRMDKALPGYTRTNGGGAGREHYRRDDYKWIASGLGQVRTMLKKDDKPWVWSVFEKDGTRLMDVGFHNEHENSDAGDKVRVAQMREVIEGALALAAKYGVEREHIGIYGDSNSYTWARVEAERLGFKSAAKTAAKRSNDKYKTHNNWKPPIEGEHFDLALYDAAVILLSWLQFLSSTLSDHHIIVTDRQITI